MFMIIEGIKCDTRKLKIGLYTNGGNAPRLIYDC
jgi:hypothetical protein